MISWAAREVLTVWIRSSLASRLRLDLDHRPVVLFRQEVNQSVGPLADIAHALVEILQHRFPALLPQLVVEDDSFQVARARNSSALDAAHKDVALPVRKLVTGVEEQARRRDARVP